MSNNSMVYPLKLFTKYAWNNQATHTHTHTESHTQSHTASLYNNSFFFN